ncbi:MAG: type II secretion system GspH family protein [Lachnospiraceae bacterium]|nr:type II secretion system GspH family protein [Lachnospiraceae bacterium]
MKNNNKGYTLVEMVIAVGMMVVISGAILVFLVNGTKSYKNTKSTVDLQLQTQTLMAQLETMAMQSQYITYDSSTNTLVFYTPDRTVAKTSDYGTKAASNIKVVQYDGTKKCLYFKEYDDPDTTIPSIVSDENLMAEYVESFNANVSKIDTNGSVKIGVTMKNKIAKFSDTQTFKIRNEVASGPAVKTP